MGGRAMRKRCRRPPLMRNINAVAHYTSCAAASRAAHDSPPISHADETRDHRFGKRRTLAARAGSVTGFRSRPASLGARQCFDGATRQSFPKFLRADSNDHGFTRHVSIDQRAGQAFQFRHSLLYGRVGEFALNTRQYGSTSADELFAPFACNMDRQERTRTQNASDSMWPATRRYTVFL